jgi:hypothetical protein
MSRRDGAIVAWHEVPGTTPPQKSRPVGYGVICAGVRTDSMIAGQMESPTVTGGTLEGVPPYQRKPGQFPY